MENKADEKVTPKSNDSDDTNNKDTKDKDVKGVELRFADLDDTVIEFVGIEPPELKEEKEHPKEEGADAQISIILLQQEMQGLKEQLGTITRERDDLYERLLRKLADFTNYRKRVEKEKQEYFQFATANIVTELLPVLDNFEKALVQCTDRDSITYKGMELIYRQLREAFIKWGVEAIDAVGLQFDPNFHEAAGREENEDIEDNLIIEEYQKGYVINKKLIRPSMVKVNVHKEPVATAENSDSDKEVGDNEESNRD